MRDGLVTMALCGDVMLGRGIDQILPRPGNPELREAHVRDARTYVRLAEAVNGPIPQPVDVTWPWGDVLPVLDDLAPDARVVNLETSVTRSDDFAPGKAVHYRMDPANLACLAAVRPDACVLANNHVLDFGRRGLAETLETLAAGGLRAVGAGRDAGEAWEPAIFRVGGDPRVLVFAFGTASSGVPPSWAAAGRRAGVGYVTDLSDATAAAVVNRVRRLKAPGDIAVVSVHWGSNWGHHVPREQVHFAHRLVDGGVDLVHGHSSHHPRPIEVYRGKLVLYGCGDLIDDYEGITGHQGFRPDLRLLYLAAVEPESGRLVRLDMTPLQARQMRLRHASGPDAQWLRAVLEGAQPGGGPSIDLEGDGTLVLRPDRS
jgi:poly-gamma-glutamate synthesis protein (capsule biosynthesis protein)